MLVERSSSSFMSSSMEISLCSFATSSSLTDAALAMVCARCHVRTYHHRFLVSVLPSCGRKL